MTYLADKQAGAGLKFAGGLHNRFLIARETVGHQDRASAKDEKKGCLVSEDHAIQMQRSFATNVCMHRLTRRPGALQVSRVHQERFP